MKQTDPAPLIPAGEHPSRLLLGRLLAGDLQGEEKAGLDSHLQGCPHCSRLFQEARRETAAFAERFPDLESLAASRRSRPRSISTPSWWENLGEFLSSVFSMRPVLAAAMALLLAGGAWLWNLQNQPAGDLSPKGQAQFHLFLNGKPADGSRDTLATAPDDALQLGITSPGPVYYALLYRDDGGELQTYMAGEKPLGNPRGENLPHSLVLDGNWKTETLYCLWSQRPFTAQEAQARIARSENPEAAGHRPDAEDGIHLQIYRLANRRP